MKQKLAVIAAASLLVFTFVISGCAAAKNIKESTASQPHTTNSQTGPENSVPTSSSVSSRSPSSGLNTQEVTITIPEGFTWDLIAKRLEANEICTAEEFYQVCQSYRPKSVTVPADNNRAFVMEGYLYPATYTFKKGEDPQNILIAMLNAYRNNTGATLTDEQLIIASIVQMETRSPIHMAMVAGIIYNRLNNGLPLQMDSTREYINNYVTDNPLLGDTSKYAALFNTYKCQALPAGPICSPGADAINAVRNPAQTDALYFFFGKDNENHYSVTYEEHQAAIAQFGVQYE